MTRAEIEAEYRVVAGRIRSPGKFEMSPVYLPHFWDLALDGCADEETDDDDHGLVSTFVVSDDDRAAFPELVGVTRVRVWEDCQGFVLCSAE